MLGSIFSNRLSSELASSLPASARGAALGGWEHQANTAALAKAPTPIHACYITAFTNALGTVFVVAAVVAGVAFLLSWALPQRQLRDSIVAGSGIGESFAMPKHTDSLAEASRALTTLIGRDRRKLFVEQLAARAGVDLSAGASWLIVRLQEDPAADIEELSERFAIPVEVGRSALEELTASGLVVLGRDDEATSAVRQLTPAGEQTATKLVDERRARASCGCARAGHRTRIPSWVS